ncbi:MAG: hypothetical protein LBH00_09265 [Planctomycetaceae bacterium]|jgi:hypothetical protein|nr:hypothetical protein [Planctomycetaceae bacterium]
MFLPPPHVLPFILLAALMLSVPVSAQTVVRRCVRPESAPNLLDPDRFYKAGKGYTAADGIYTCQNNDEKTKSGIVQNVFLNQNVPAPLTIEAVSKAENVSGSPSGDYSIYVDIIYNDGTPLWGQIAPFSTGTHDWEKKSLTIYPKKPVKNFMVYLQFQNKSGKAEFKNIKLTELTERKGVFRFDGVSVVPQPRVAGQTPFSLRDVAAGSDFVALTKNVFGLESSVQSQGAVTRVTLTNPAKKDRCLTLVYAIPVPAEGLIWCENPRTSVAVKPDTEYMSAHSFHGIGANSRMSSYPFAAVAGKQGGLALGIDMKTPVFFRAGYHSGTEELFVSADFALTPESPSVTVDFVKLAFDSEERFRGALAAYYKQFPADFAGRTPEQGIWMPFASISKIPNYEDFGFKFKEADSETAWDDAHNILTFRYTEPMTWWMPIPKDQPQTYDQAMKIAKEKAEKKDPRAMSLFTSGIRDIHGKPVCRVLVTPWNGSGAVWSMNDLPGIKEGGFALKWNPAIYDTYYRSNSKGELDGEYIDSCGGGPSDYNRSNFAAAKTPLVFSHDEHRPLIFGGMIMFEYIRKIAEDMHKNHKLIMANGPPGAVCWLVPYLDVMGIETDWNPGGKWTPPPDAVLLQRRSLCGAKPYCFLMNTEFSRFSYELSERYMKRCLAYGMFPGYFSADASTKAYFTRPELYERDRPLFRKYIPLCKKVAESGWQPVTLAKSNAAKVFIERFGAEPNKCYYTVFNDSAETETAVLTFRNNYVGFRNLVSGEIIKTAGQSVELTLQPAAVAVLEPLP